MILTFDKKQLHYDVANACYVISRSLRSSHSASANDFDCGSIQALVADVADEGNRDIIRRSLDVAFSNAATAAGGWPGNDIECADNSPLKGNYILDVALPAASGNATSRRMLQLVHRYMVEFAVHDWLLLTVPSLALSQRNNTDYLLDQIRALRVWGAHGARIKPHPF